MSAESLSPNQVANLRKAMESALGGEDPQERHQPSSGTRLASSEPGPSVEEPEIRAYDFKRPDRIGKDHMHTLWSLHASLARDFSNSFSRLLRAPLDVKLSSMDAVAYGDFVSSRQKPSCLGVITPAPLDGSWMLDIAPPLAFAIIDRMLGGDPVPGENICRPLTEVETRLMSRVVTLFLDQIISAWTNVAKLQPELESIESTPHRVPIAGVDDPVILVGFEVHWGKNSGQMTLCIPVQSVEKCREKLSERGRDEQGNAPSTVGNRSQIAGKIDAANVNVVVTLARSRIKTSDLLGLAVGDIITTEQEIAHPLEVAIQEIPKFQASAGAYHGKKAVQIRSVIEPR
tara:strand:- start:36 stop:1070 length:1035 start_codon:yes stop_codon:yes gene_type:complete